MGLTKGEWGTMETRIKNYVEGYLRELGDDIALEPDDDLVSMGFDSIGYVRLLEFIVTELGIHVPDSDVTVEQFGSIANIAAYLESRSAPVGDATG